MLCTEQGIVNFDAHRRSRAELLQLFQIKISVCCIVPILVTLLNDAPALWDGLTNVAKHKKSDLYLGFPFVVLWSFVLLLCLLVHVCELLVSRTLIEAWSPRQHRKRQ